MKRNILLLFGLIGLVALECGCDDIPPPCNSNSFSVFAIDSTQILQTDSNGYLSPWITDSVAFDAFQIKVDFKTELISYVASSSSLYATSPCPPPSTNWFIENISIIEVNEAYNSDWEVTERCYENNYTDVDSIRGNEFWNVPIDMYLRPKSAPNQKDTYQFKIVIETTKGEIFETVTDPIIITP